MAPLTTEQALEARKDELERLLTEKEPELMRQYLEVSLSLKVVKELAAASNEYSRFKAPIDAIEEHFRRTAEPLTIPETIKAVVGRGFGKNDPKVEINTRAAINYALSQSGRLVKVDRKKIFLPDKKSDS